MDHDDLELGPADWQISLNYADDNSIAASLDGSTVVGEGGILAPQTLAYTATGADAVREIRIALSHVGTPVGVFTAVNFDQVQLMAVPANQLQPGDANQDLSFDHLDIVQVLQAAKYLTGEPATWGEGDWDGAPGGEPGNPPPGNGQFDQLDIIAALSGGWYLTGPYLPS